MSNKSYSFLVVGKTQQSTEAQEFKRYVGVGSSFVVAVNPTKKELEDIYGREIATAPEYVVNKEDGKEARISFIVKTDPSANNDIDLTARAMFTLRNAPAYNRDQTKVQVIDQYGNSTWANTEDAKAGKKILSSSGKELMFDSKYHIACVGEADLVNFLKHYLNVGTAYKYVNGSWVKKDDAADYVFNLEHIKDYFNGNFSEIKEAIALQPNNKVKLLYGVRTAEDGKQYQVVATRNNMILPNYAGSNAYIKLEKELSNMKNNGAYPSTEFKVQELSEYKVEATDLSSPSTESTSGDMPWD